MLTEAYTKLCNAFGTNNTLAAFKAVPAAERSAKLREISSSMDRGARFAQVLVWAALNVKDLEDDSFASLKKLAVAYKVGFISFETYAEMLDAHLKGYQV